MKKVMKPNFRKMAREAVEAAKVKLRTNCESDVVDAALRLRMSMEALTYERATAYAEDLGPERMKTWQPKQLMDRILEVDPHADRDRTLSMGVEPSYGKKPDQWTLLGTENVLKLSTLRDHYNALGSFLHTPTLRQIEEDRTHDITKLRDRCTRIIDAVDVVLSSRIWGTTFTDFGSIDCQQCGEKLRRRIPYAVDCREIACWNCTASYWMRRIGKGQVEYEPQQISIGCVSRSCEGTNDLWKSEMECGTRWKCGSCGKNQELAWCVTEVAVDSVQEKSKENSTSETV